MLQKRTLVPVRKTNMEHFVSKPLTKADLAASKYPESLAIALNHPLLPAEKEKLLITKAHEGLAAKEELAHLERFRSRLINSGVPARAIPSRVRKLEDCAIQRDFALDELVASNFRLAMKVAERYFSHEVLSVEDLTMIGCASIPHLVDNFDYGKSTKFSTYAVAAFVSIYKRAIDKFKVTGKIGLNRLYRTKRLIAEAEARFSEETGGINPTLTDISEFSGLEIEEIRLVREVLGKTVSLDAPISVEDERPLGDTISADLDGGKFEDEPINNIYSFELREFLEKIRQMGIAAKLIGFEKNYQYLLLSFGIFPDGTDPERIQKIIANRNPAARNNPGLLLREIPIFLGEKSHTREASRQRIEKAKKQFLWLVSEMEDVDLSVLEDLYRE